MESVPQFLMYSGILFQSLGGEGTVAVSVTATVTVTVVTKVLIDKVVCKLYSVELAVSRRYCY